MVGVEGIWTHEGPYGGNVGSVVIDPNNSNVVYVAGWGDPPSYNVNGFGVYKSTNAAETWDVATNGLGNLCVRHLAIHSNDSQILYAATYNGVYKSTDGAGSWSAASTGLGSTELNWIAIDPSTASTLYVGATTGGVWKSANSAGSWTEANTGLDTNTARKIYGIAVNPSNSATLYLATYDKVYKSTNSAASWYQVGAGDITDSYISGIVIDSSAPDTLYIAVPTGATDLYKSTNGGVTWAASDTGLAADMWGLSLAIDQDNPSTVYAGAYCPAPGVYKSTNSAANWTRMTTDSTVFLARPYTLAVRGNDVYAGHCYLSGVYKSEDGGENWSWKSEGLAGLSGGRSLYITLCRDVPTTIYVGAFYYDKQHSVIWKSADGGLTWNEPRAAGALSGFTVKPTDPDVLYAGRYKRYYRSGDGGLTWTDATSGLTDGNYYSCVLHPTEIGCVYGAGRTNLSISTDDGFSYTSLGTGWPGVVGGAGYVSSLAINPVDTNMMYATVTYKGLYKSTDAGATWSTTGQFDGIHPSLFIDPVNTNIMYALYAYTAGWLKKSTDSGESWTNLVSDYVRSFAFHPQDPRVLYLGRYDGLYSSTDGGENFTRIALEGKQVDGILIAPNTSTSMKPTTMWVITPVPGGLLRYYLRPPVGSVISIR